MWQHDRQGCSGTLGVPGEPSCPADRGPWMHQRRGSRSGCVVIRLPYATSVPHAEPEVPRHVLLAMFEG
jgi:hypothetical protein